jgi:GTPase involved in cell partitioning and DNA repair
MMATTRQIHHTLRCLTANGDGVHAVGVMRHRQSMMTSPAANATTGLMGDNSSIKHRRDVCGKVRDLSCSLSQIRRSSAFPKSNIYTAQENAYALSHGPWTLAARGYQVLGEIAAGGGFKSYDKSISPDIPVGKKKAANKKTGSKHRKQRGQSGYKFVDRARIQARGGEGGKGCLSFHKFFNGKKRPNGGHGGHGGAVIFVAQSQEQSLRFSKPHFRGPDGTNGTSNNANGRNGRNTVIRVPCGVVVHRVLQYYEMWDEELREVLIKPEYETEFGALDEADGQGEEDSDDNEDFRMLPKSRMTRKQREQFDAEEQESQSANDLEGEYDDDEEDDDDDKEDDDDDEEDDDDEDEESDEEQELSAGIWRRGPDGLYDTSFLSSQRNPFVDDYKPIMSGKLRDDMDDEIYAQHHTVPIEERERVILADLDQPGSYVVVAKGGKGGTGNGVDAKYRHSPLRQKRAVVRARRNPGDVAFLELELKMIADLGTFLTTTQWMSCFGYVYVKCSTYFFCLVNIIAGLVGFPNAGKSSLLAAMSKAQPEIAPYPFTTLHPLVGIIEYRDNFRISAADIPGLIEGAHAGRGRGSDFLKHLERTKALLYIVDAAGVDGRDPLSDLKVLVSELASYGNGELLGRNALVVANKLDLIPNEDERDSLLLELESIVEETGIQMEGGQVFGISAGVTGEGLPCLSREIRSVVLKSEQQRASELEDDLRIA